MFRHTSETQRAILAFFIGAQYTHMTYNLEQKCGSKIALAPLGEGGHV